MDKTNTVTISYTRDEIIEIITAHTEDIYELTGLSLDAVYGLEAVAADELFQFLWRS